MVAARNLGLLGIGGLGLGLGTIVWSALRNPGIIVSGPAKSTEDYTPVVYVTGATIVVYYIFLFNQSATVFNETIKAHKAYREKKTDQKPSLVKLKYGSDNPNILAANRCAGNFSEQLLPFLVSVFLYATVVSVNGAVKFGWSWLFFRSYYLYVFKKGVPTLFLSTIPSYCCVWAMIGGMIYEVSQVVV